ncbi:MAG TPA: HD domain-containing phosphohydrolase, partial [Gemmatimonadaceae bacterium]|nr:HD domain-containing phosphohydrolase [Gemmatimonadaceae bacterium]
ISLGGRILAAADAYDALTSKRAYREPMSAEEVVGFLADHSGSLLDPRVYEALKKVVERRKALPFIDDVHA